MSPLPPFLLLLLLLLLLPIASRSGCPPAVPCTALASYLVSARQNLTYIGHLFGIDSLDDLRTNIPLYNPNISSIDNLPSDSPLYVPFTCRRSSGGPFLAGDFLYAVQSSDTYDKIAQGVYKNLTTVAWMKARNRYPETNIPDGAFVNVTVNCSCGDRAVSGDYGLFVTYPLQRGDTAASVAKSFGFAHPDLLQGFNEGVDFGSGAGIVFVPFKHKNGSYLSLSACKRGISGGSIAGISVAVGVSLLVFVVLFVIFKQKKKKEHSLHTPLHGEAARAQEVSLSMIPGESSLVNGVTVDKSVEFSYEELAAATHNFSMANKIGEGGFGAVYYAELRGERTAVKKMGTQSDREFLAELQVLTRVHHLNLVRLVGYCTAESLFLIYEYMENGNLSQHLRDSAQAPLSWAARVQIALDSARGLEYIHEHTVPVYIHRDIKSANILLDNKFRAKVADFGLTKLSQAKNTSKDVTVPTRVVGTFGYMPPEYAQYGEVSPKIDVYAFGVVLYELLSAKSAVFRTSSGGDETKGLVSLFDGVLNHPDPRGELLKIIDPRLEDYPMDAVFKMAELGKACTQENPHLRPNMRAVVVALMVLSSATEDWDLGQFYDKSTYAHLMSGR